jgi:hypothetical protein
MAQAAVALYTRALKTTRARRVLRRVVISGISASFVAGGLTGVIAPVASASVRPRFAAYGRVFIPKATPDKPTWDPKLRAELAAFGATLKPPQRDNSSAGTLPDTSTQSPTSASTFSSTYKEPDGSLWTEYSSAPLNFRNASGHWQRIDPTLHPVAGQPGNFISGANTWHVTVGPLPGGGVELYSGHQHLSLVAKGASHVAPEVDPSDPTRVTYKDAWPGTDLSYTVTPAGIKEDILIKGPSAPSTFDFSTRGADLGRPGQRLAGPGHGLPANWYFVAPATTDRRGRPQPGSGVALSADGTGASVSVNAKWLHHQPASAFPIDLDPSVGYDVNGIPPWLWDGSDAAVFCLSSAGYSGHPSGGPYTTCTLPSGYVGAKIGYDGMTDWQTELAFDVPSPSTIEEPPGCDATTVGSVSQPPDCIVVRWAQLGLGTGSGQENSGPGYVNVFAGKADYTYGDVGPTCSPAPTKRRTQAVRRR